MRVAHAHFIERPGDSGQTLAELGNLAAGNPGVERVVIAFVLYGHNLARDGLRDTNEFACRALGLGRIRFQGARVDRRLLERVSSRHEGCDRPSARSSRRISFIEQLRPSPEAQADEREYKCAREEQPQPAPGHHPVWPASGTDSRQGGSPSNAGRVNRARNWHRPVQSLVPKCRYPGSGYDQSQPVRADANPRGGCSPDLD